MTLRRRGRACAAAASCALAIAVAGSVARADAPAGSPDPKATPPADGSGKSKAASSSDPDASAPPVAPPPPTPIDVSIHEELKPPDVVSLTRAEARLVPGTFGDPFRVVEALPGVVPLASGVPYFYVRGAPPGNVGYFLDGIRVPLLYHLGLGPSVVHPALIDHVELHPGGDPTIGRFSGGVVTADLAEPRSEIHGEANIRVIDAGAFVEVPFADGRGSAMAAGRYSYTGPLFTLLKSDTVLRYGDYAARVMYRFTPKHRLSIFAFGAYDYLGQKDTTQLSGPIGSVIEQEKTSALFDTMFHRIDLRYDQVVDDKTSLRHDVILGWDETHLDEGRDIVDRMLAVKSAMRHTVNDDVELRAGIDFTVDDYQVDLARGSDPDPFTSFFTSRTDTALGLFDEVSMRVNEHFEVVPALRLDLYTSGSRVALGADPSVSIRVPIDQHFAFVTSHGLSSQPPSFIVSGPGFRPALDDHGLQRSFMSSVGVEWSPDASWVLKAVGYRATFFALNDALGTSTLATQGFPDGLSGFDQRFDGWSMGLELSAKRRLTKRIGAIVAYTLGRSERYAPLGERVPSGFDRTHVASAALSFDFGSGWHGGVRNLFYTGTPVLDRVPVASSNVDPAPTRIVDTGRRQAPFFRTDVRLEKRWKVLQRGHISLIVEMLNTFVAKEVVGTSCKAGICTETKIGPVAVPSLGLEGGF